MASPRFRCQAYYKKRVGELTLGPQELDWTLAGGSQPELRIAGILCKLQIAQAQNKSEKVILKVTVCPEPGQPEVNHNFTFTSATAGSDREHVISTLANALAQRGGASAAARTKSPSATPQLESLIGGGPKNLNNGLSGEERQIRLTILQENKELGELFKSLVLSNLVSEEDFWATRRHMMTYQKWQKNQKKGSLGAIAEVKPTDGEGTDMKFKITEEVIASILAQYPPVRKAYADNVPIKMTKEAFMRKYLESKYYQRKPGTSSSTSDEFFSQYEDDDDDDYAIHPKSSKYDRSHMLLDLAAQTEDHGETGNRPDNTMRAGNVKSSLPLIRQFNRVSEGVLKSSLKPLDGQQKQSEQTADAIYLDSTDLYDLRVSTVTPSRPLNITDSGNYFQSQTRTDAHLSSTKDRPAADPEVLIPAFNQKVSSWQPQLADLAIDRTKAGQVLQNLNSLTQKRKREYQKNRHMDVTLNKNVISMHAAAVELLRSYWGLAKDKDLNKAARIVDALQDLAQKAQDLDAARTKDPQGKQEVVVVSGRAQFAT
ncbi:hypothetical protein DFS34DRAFT_577822 [Phlyctochytrium arcticum]|nr:hypothetical protein DFS34DRAFT_577822 [Phlyctochytrium arcticum]